MFAKTPKTATAMALALGLVAPLPAGAQAAGEAALPECTTMVTLPCVTSQGATVETQEELDTYIEAFPEEAAAAAERALEDTAEEVTGESGAAPETEPEGEAPAEGEAAPADEDGAEPPAAEGETPEEDAAAEPMPAEGEAPMQDAAAEPAPAEGEAPSAETAAGPAPADGQAPAQDAATAPAVPETPVAEEAMDEAVAAPAPEAAPEAPDAPLAEGVADPVEGGTVEADIPVVESEIPPAAAADETAARASAQVEEMMITEDTARSATEEFETAIGAEPPAAAPADEDGGLSDIQRAIVAGLAGAAIGAITGQGGEVVANTGDRLVVRGPEGDLRVLRDENALLRQPGARVRTETFDDGSTRTTVIREDGSEIVTIRAVDGRVLRRTRILPDGERIVLFDDTREVAPVDVAQLPAPRAEAMEYRGDEASLRAALAETLAEDLGRSFSLRQVREIRAVRELAPEIEIDAINFATGSAAIRPDQAQELSALGRTLAAMIDENPGELFLVEGHTDAVGDARYNLALSDRRAETLALALTEFFDVPPENLVVQGYGESDLKIPTAGAETENRRANVRRITPLLGTETAMR